MILYTFCMSVNTGARTSSHKYAFDVTNGCTALFLCFANDNELPQTSGWVSRGKLSQGQRGHVSILRRTHNEEQLTSNCSHGFFDLKTGPCEVSAWSSFQSMFLIGDDVL